MSKTFHIRQKRPLNQKTLCGAEKTSHDDRYSWQALPVGDYVPCAECLRIREEQKREKKLAKAT